MSIVLNKEGVAAWKAAGYEKHVNFGARVMALRLLFKDVNNKDVAVFLVSAYAPVGNAPDQEWDVYLDKLSSCMNKKRKGDILIIGSDCNSSVGCNTGNDDGPLGKNGLSHTNASGLRFFSFLAMHQLKAATTWFPKRTYATWIHPRSKNPHQIDHFLVSNEMFPRILNAGQTKQLLDSDHSAIMVTIRVMKRLKRNIDKRKQLLNLDYSMLLDSDVKQHFLDEVIRLTPPNDTPTYSNFATALKSAAESSLPRKIRSQPDWFSEKQDTLLSLINTRNLYMQKVLQRRTRSNSANLRKARKQLKTAILDSKNDWLKKPCQLLNNFGTKQAWDSIKKLKGTLTKIKPSSTKQMKHSDGTLCSTPEENAEVFHLHFQSLYDREGTYDPDVLDDLLQHPFHNGLDHEPTDDEIRTATFKLRDRAPGESGILPCVFKCIIDCQETFMIFKTVLLDIWNTENIPEEWNLGRLIILPKKGDLSLPKNYRGIMLLEIAYKVVAIIIQARLSPIVEQLDHEQQCGFRPNRGCVDAVFTIKSALRKRREHGLESWVLFLDLVKAFDRVPKKLLWEILTKFGVPIKLVSLLKALHKDFTVKFSIDDIDKSIRNTIGVKQGDILGPILFLFFICAVMTTWRSNFHVEPCIFRSKRDAKMTGRSYTARGESFHLLDSEYADDTAVLFDSRGDVTEGIYSINEHFDRFGTEIHTGVLQPRDNSKTEVLFCSKPFSLYNTPDTYDNADLSDIINDRYIPIVQEFCYLGSIVSSDCSDDKDVEMRIRKSSNAFGALRKSVFGSNTITDERVVFGCRVVAEHHPVRTSLVFATKEKAIWCEQVKTLEVPCHTSNSYWKTVDLVGDARRKCFPL